MGISPPTALTIDLMADSFTGFPAKAPFKSTKCKRLPPRSTQWRAIAPGSSENTVDSSIKPCFSLTHWPSLRSIAGIINIVVLDYN